MAETVNNKAVLILADGTIIYGNAFGKKGVATGEICFNTGMTGYQEVFTDPRLLWPGTDHEQCTHR